MLFLHATILHSLLEKTGAKLICFLIISPMIIQSLRFVNSPSACKVTAFLFWETRAILLNRQFSSFDRKNRP